MPRWPLSVADRFWSNVPVRKVGECWEWQGTRKSDGTYGRFYMDGRYHPAHRVAWEYAMGRPFPEGKLPLHRCHNKPCVNPTHIYVGTKADNMLDVYDTGWVHWARRKTHCKRGHPLSGDNVRLRPGKRGPLRSCKTCQRERERKAVA